MSDRWSIRPVNAVQARVGGAVDPALYGVKADVCATRRGSQWHAVADPADDLAAPQRRFVFFGMAEYAGGVTAVAQAYGRDHRRWRTRRRSRPHAYHSITVLCEVTRRRWQLSDPEAVALRPEL